MGFDDRAVYEFGRFKVVTAKHLLLRDGRPVPLTPKAFSTLLVLVERKGQDVSKDELMKEVWPNTFVEEGGLARNISVLRKALQEGTSDHEYIETIPRIGYRFVADVKKTHDTAPIRSISVLPFKTLGVQGDEDFLGAGIADALITKLSNIRELVTRPTSAVLRYARQEQDPIDAGRELGTDAVLDGHIQKYGDRIRATVQLFNVATGTPVWADRFDETFTNVFTLQDSISEKVVRTLTHKITGEQRELITKRYTDDAEAYQDYLKGRYFWNKRDPQSLQKAVGFFKQTIAKDEGYALAHSGLADCLVLLVMYGVCHAAKAMAEAKAAAEKAVALEDSLAEAHTSLAYVNATYYWDWRKARREFERAIELNPGYPTAHHWYGIFLLMSGKVEEALEELTLAQNIDPLSLSINTDIGWAFYFARDYRRAVEQYLSTIELDPTFLRVYWFIGQSYVQLGMFEEAFAAYDNALRLSDHPLTLSFLGHAYGLCGRREEALEVLARLSEMARERYISPYFVALIHIGLGQKAEAFAWLEKVLLERFWVLSFLKIDATFDPLRDDAQYKALERGVEAAQIV
jgi:DNA-binding winged helix-turn-helix (wHTH) protein/tetratricopeptide (TPR) repeat protein